MNTGAGLSAITKAGPPSPRTWGSIWRITLTFFGELLNDSTTWKQSFVLLEVPRSSSTSGTPAHRPAITRGLLLSIASRLDSDFNSGALPGFTACSNTRGYRERQRARCSTATRNEPKSRDPATQAFELPQRSRQSSSRAALSLAELRSFDSLMHC